MKNIQENIYRLKSLMNLITEGSTNPKDWKVGEYYIQTRSNTNVRNIIKVTYKDEYNISYDYVEYDEVKNKKIKTGSENLLSFSQVPTQADGAIWQESNETEWNEKSNLETTDDQIPKINPKDLSRKSPYPHFIKDESLNILYDGKYYVDNSENNKLDEKGNLKDGLIGIWCTVKNELSTKAEIDLKNNFPTNTSWSNVFNALNTTTINSENNFTGDVKLYYDIFIKNYTNLIVGALITLDSSLVVYDVLIFTKLNDGKLSWGFSNVGLIVKLNWEGSYNYKIENEKIILTSDDGTIIPFDSNETKPTTSPTETPIVKPDEYSETNNFSSIADDIYQDLITNKIKNVKIKSSSNQKYSSDQKTLESIDFILDVDGLEMKATFSNKGLSLFNNTDKKQVKPVWNDIELKWRKFNSEEKRKNNEWEKSKIELKLEQIKKRFEQLI